MSNPPAAWYEDPSGAPLTQRYWDGVAWTAHTRPVAPPPPPPRAVVQTPYVQTQPGAYGTRPYGQGFADVTQNNPQNYAGNQVSYAADSVTFKEALRGHFSLKGSTTNGRTSVQQWAWSNFLFTPLIVVAVSLAYYALESYIRPPAGFVMSGTGATVLAVAGVLNVVLRLVFAAQIITITVRRLHDTGRPGWYLLIAFIPFGALVLLYWLLKPGVHEKTRFDE